LPQKNTQNTKEKSSFFVPFLSAKGCPLGRRRMCPFMAHSFPAFPGHPSLSHCKMSKIGAFDRVHISTITLFAGNANYFVEYFLAHGRRRWVMAVGGGRHPQMIVTRLSSARPMPAPKFKRDLFSELT
jgi:hypothetical protein